jgi:hypothetical protein
MKTGLLLGVGEQTEVIAKAIDTRARTPDTPTPARS